ncbi:tetratricopeptide repeat [Sparganum proliferum]
MDTLNDFSKVSGDGAYCIYNADPDIAAACFQSAGDFMYVQGEHSPSKQLDDKEIKNLFNKSAAFLSQFNPVPALDLLDKLSVLLENKNGKRNYDFEIENLYIQYATAYEQMEQKADAVTYLKKAIDIIEPKLSSNSSLDETYRIALTELLADIRKRYAINQETTDVKPLISAVSWLKAAKAYKACNSACDAAYAALRAIRWFITARDTKSATSTLSWALSLTKSLKFSPEQGVLFNELGIAFMAFEHTTSAIKCFVKAHARLESQGTLLRASVLQNLGSAYAIAEDFSEAISALGAAVDAYGRVGNRAGQAQAGCNMAYALARSGALRKARWQYALAREAARDAQWPAVQLQAEEALAAMDFQDDRPLNGIKHLKAALALCPSVAASQTLEQAGLDLLQSQFSSVSRTRRGKTSTVRSQTRVPANATKKATNKPSMTIAERPVPRFPSRRPAENERSTQAPEYEEKDILIRREKLPLVSHIRNQAFHRISLRKLNKDHRRLMSKLSEAYRVWPELSQHSSEKSRFDCNSECTGSEQSHDDSRLAVNTGEDDICLSPSSESQMSHAGNHNDNASNLRPVALERPRAGKNDAKNKRSLCTTVALSDPLKSPTPPYSRPASAYLCDEDNYGEIEGVDEGAGRIALITRQPSSVMSLKRLEDMPKSTQELIQLDNMLEKLTTKFVEEGASETDDEAQTDVLTSTVSQKSTLTAKEVSQMANNEELDGEEVKEGESTNPPSTATIRRTSSSLSCSSRLKSNRRRRTKE